jgi:hypothetical protein
MLSRVRVAIDGIWIGDLARPVTAIYTSLTNTGYCPQSITLSTSRLLATDFNTGTITVSLNITHEAFYFTALTFN